MFIKSSFKIVKIASYILTCFSGFFLINATISPIYIAFCVGLLLFAIWIERRGYRVYISAVISIIVFAIFYFVISQTFIGGNLSLIFGVSLSLVYYIIGTSLFASLKKNDIEKIVILFSRFSIVIYCFEAYWRLSHPVILNVVLDWFYAYKISSVFFLDSNFVAIFLLNLFFLIQFIFKGTNRLIIERCLIFVLLVLTFSRSCVLTLIVGLCIYFYIYGLKSRIWRVVIGWGVGLIGLFKSFLILRDDASFLSKFEILNKSYNFMLNASLEQLFLGIGFGNSPKFIGIGAHNIFVIYFLEAGLVGGFIFFMVQYYIYLDTKKAGIWLMLPLIIAGMSLSAVMIPYYYLSLAIIHRWVRIEDENVIIRN